MSRLSSPITKTGAPVNLATRDIDAKDRITRVPSSRGRGVMVEWWHSPLRDSIAFLNRCSHFRVRDNMAVITRSI